MIITRHKLYNGLFEIRDYERLKALKTNKSILLVLDIAGKVKEQMTLSHNQLRDGKFINTQYSKYNTKPYGMWGYEWKPIKPLPQARAMDIFSTLTTTQIEAINNGIKYGETGKITVYRASKDGKIVPGDFVTTSKQGAETYIPTMSTDYKISKLEVPQNELFRDHKGDWVWNPRVAQPLQGNAGLYDTKITNKPYKFQYTTDELPQTGKAIEYKGKIVGGVDMRPQGEQFGGGNWLANIELKPEYRNQGIGRKVIEQLQAEGKPISGFAESKSASDFFKKVGAKVDTEGNFVINPRVAQPTKGKVKAKVETKTEIKTVKLDDNYDLIYTGNDVFGEDKKRETIKIGDLKFDKDEVEERLKDLEPIE